jgi:hypothetical protein
MICMLRENRICNKDSNSSNSRDTLISNMLYSMMKKANNKFNEWIQRDWEEIDNLTLCMTI